MPSEIEISSYVCLLSMSSFNCAAVYFHNIFCSFIIFESFLLFFFCIAVYSQFCYIFLLCHCVITLLVYVVYARNLFKTCVISLMELKLYRFDKHFVVCIFIIVSFRKILHCVPYQIEGKHL